MSDEMLDLIREQNRLLKAQLAVLTEKLLRETDLGSSRFENIETLLSDGGGLKNVEIAALLGKSPQAVGQSIARQRNR